MNRLQSAIDKMEVSLAKLSPAIRESISDQLNISFEEFYMFNKVHSRNTDTRITFEEAMTAYTILGESGPDRFNKSPVHVKFALTKFIQEVMTLERKSQPFTYNQLPEGNGFDDINTATPNDD